MSDFVLGFIVAMLLAKSGADAIIWKWITERWRAYKENNKPADDDSD